MDTFIEWYLFFGYCFTPLVVVVAWVVYTAPGGTQTLFFPIPHYETFWSVMTSIGNLFFIAMLGSFLVPLFWLLLLAFAVLLVCYSASSWAREDVLGVCRLLKSYDGFVGLLRYFWLGCADVENWPDYPKAFPGRGTYLPNGEVRYSVLPETWLEKRRDGSLY